LEAQALFAEANLEYPVHLKAALDPLAQSWGSFKQDQKISVSPASAKRKPCRPWIGASRLLKNEVFSAAC
jgi:hypothetical protein